MTPHTTPTNDIDRMARHLVDAEPAPGLEARIAARLDALAAPTDAPRWTWWSWRVAVPLTCAALLTLVVWHRERPNPVPDQSSAQATSARTELPGPPASTKIPAERPPALAGSAAESPAQGVPVVRPASASLTPDPLGLDQREAALLAEQTAWMSRRIPTLQPVEAIAVTELAFDPLNSSGSTQPEPLSITPLIMTTLPTPPVNTGGTRDH